MSEIRPRKDKDLFVKDVPNPICYVTQKIREKIYPNMKKKKTRTYWCVVRAKRKLGDR
jgi:hypothetical protein